VERGGWGTGGRGEARGRRDAACGAAVRRGAVGPRRRHDSALNRVVGVARGPLVSDF
jgi:hypothetical protein